MDDQRAHFQLMFVDAYGDARLGELLLEIDLSDGSRAGGIPRAPILRDFPSDDGDGHVELDDHLFALADICAYTVRSTSQIIEPTPDADEPPLV